MHRPHLEIVDRDIENPMWSRVHDGDKTNPRLIRGQVNTLESPISYLASKGVLEPHQVAAADIFRQLYERVGGSGAKAMDYTQPFVDGGNVARSPLREGLRHAGLELVSAHDALDKAYGLYGYRLVCYICGEGRHIRELTATRRQETTMIDNLKAYLDCLAEHWNLSTTRRKVG